MSGVRLLELDSRDLVDVLHYMFEEDLTAVSSEAIEVKDKIRSSIYEDLYFRRYDYASSKNVNASGYSLDDPLDEEIGPPIQQFDPSPMKKATKGYVPPTKFNPDAQNPYHGVLDEPFG